MPVDEPAKTPWTAYLEEVTSRQGWSVARLARESGLDRSTIFRWMGGATGANVDSIKKIARAAGDDPEVVLRAAAIVIPDAPRDDDPDAEAVKLILAAEIPEQLKAELIAELRAEARQDVDRRRSGVERVLKFRVA